MSLKFLVASDLLATAKDIGLQDNDIIVVDNLAVSGMAETNARAELNDRQDQLKRDRRALHMRGVKK